MISLSIYAVTLYTDRRLRKLTPHFRGEVEVDAPRQTMTKPRFVSSNVAPGISLSGTIERTLRYRTLSAAYQMLHSRANNITYTEASPERPNEVA